METVNGRGRNQQPLALFELLDESDLGLTDSDPGLLDERECRLVMGAANFHALATPGRILRIIVLRGPRGALPSLTDRTVHQVEWDDDREVVGSMVLRSTVQPMDAVAPPTGVVGLVVDVGGGSAYGNTYRASQGRQGRVRRTARFLAPIQFDAFRQLRTDVVEYLRHDRSTPRRAPVRPHRATRRGVTAGPPAVLFGLHWLEARWCRTVGAGNHSDSRSGRSDSDRHHRPRVEQSVDHQAGAGQRSSRSPDPPDGPCHRGSISQRIAWNIRYSRRTCAP